MLYKNGLPKGKVWGLYGRKLLAERPQKNEGMFSYTTCYTLVHWKGRDDRHKAAIGNQLNGMT